DGRCGRGGRTLRSHTHGRCSCCSRTWGFSRVDASRIEGARTVTISAPPRLVLLEKTRNVKNVTENRAESTLPCQDREKRPDPRRKPTVLFPARSHAGTMS